MLHCCPSLQRSSPTKIFCGTKFWLHTKYQSKQKGDDALDIIKVIDARMGRGKTSAAIRYMSENEGKKRFLYITPYLKEVDRICDACDFEQPDGDHSSKLSELKYLMHRKRNVASTHSLFHLMDEDSLALVKENEYCLIVDEAIDVISQVNITKKDTELILSAMADTDEYGFLHWRDPGYDGKFSQYKEMADNGTLFVLDNALLRIMNPALLTAFKEVIMMTYLFNGQYQKAYLDYFGFPYRICGIDNTDGHRFTDSPDSPPPLDYRSMISVIHDEKLNCIGDHMSALSKTWYDRHGPSSDEIKVLKNGMNTFFRRRTNGKSSEQLWTCFKNDAPKLYGAGNRFASSFLQLAAKATNEYRNRKYLAYTVNRYINPNIAKFFSAKNIVIDEDEFALADMLQWIWRSCIRDDKPIELYIPSRRMRELLLGWIESTYQGGVSHE